MLVGGLCDFIVSSLALAKSLTITIVCIICILYKRGKYIFMATCEKVRSWNIHMFKFTFFLQCSPEVCQSNGRRFRWKTRFYGQEVMQLHNWSFGGISEFIESVGWRPDSSLYSVLLDTTISQAKYFMSIEYICHH